MWVNYGSKVVKMNAWWYKKKIPIKYECISLKLALAPTTRAWFDSGQKNSQNKKRAKKGPSWHGKKNKNDMEIKWNYITLNGKNNQYISTFWSRQYISTENIHLQRGHKLLQGLFYHIHERPKETQDIIHYWHIKILHFELK